jgi:hypothetical protein
VLGLELADALRAFEPLGEEMHQSGVDIVDAAPDVFQRRAPFGLIF